MNEQSINNQTGLNKGVFHESLVGFMDQALRKIGMGNFRTLDCGHDGSCIGSMLASTLKTCFAAYGVRTLLSLLFGIKNIIKSPNNVGRILLDKNNMRFGAFLGSFIFLFRSILCLARRKTTKQQYKYIIMLSGFIGATLSVFILQKSTRQALGLFLFVRALDISYHSLVNKNILPGFKYFYILMYSLSMVISGIVYSNQPGSISKQTLNFYKIFSNQTIGDMQLRQITTQRYNIKLAKKGIAPQNFLDIMPKLRQHYDKVQKIK